MPTGVITNVLSVAAGGVIGAVCGTRLSERLKEGLNTIFGVCAMGLGISLLIQVENITPVIFAVIIGTLVGLVIRLGDGITAAAGAMQRSTQKLIKNKNASLSEEAFSVQLVTIIVLFCASGSGIYGTLISGMTGDHSILIAKSILDFFTAMIFATVLGMVVAMIALPQLVIYLILFLLAGLIYPMTTPGMIADFKACGGLLLFATGLRMNKVVMYPTADMIPAMVLVMPFSWFWTTYVLQWVT